MEDPCQIEEAPRMSYWRSHFFAPGRVWGLLHQSEREEHLWRCSSSSWGCL